MVMWWARCSHVEMLTTACCGSGQLVGPSKTVIGRLRCLLGLGAACDQHLSVSSPSWNCNGESKTSCWPDESQLVSIFWCVFYLCCLLNSPPCADQRKEEGRVMGGQHCSLLVSWIPGAAQLHVKGLRGIACDSKGENWLWVSRQRC